MRVAFLPAFAVGAALAIAGCSPPPCTAGRILCGDICRDSRGDRDDGGACGVAETTASPSTCAAPTDRR